MLPPPQAAQRCAHSRRCAVRADPVDVLHLPRVGGDHAAAVPAAEDGGPSPAARCAALRCPALPPASAGAPAACALCSSLRACVLRLVGRWQVTDVLTWHYVFCMGMYRAFYLLNWVWRYMTQEGYSDWIVWVAGIVQTILYLDFFYYYIKCKLDGKQVALPQ